MLFSQYKNRRRRGAWRYVAREERSSFRNKQPPRVSTTLRFFSNGWNFLVPLRGLANKQWSRVFMPEPASIEPFRLFAFQEKIKWNSDTGAAPMQTHALPNLYPQFNPELHLFFVLPSGLAMYAGFETNSKRSWIKYFRWKIYSEVVKWIFKQGHQTIWPKPQCTYRQLHWFFLEIVGGLVDDTQNRRFQDRSEKRVIARLRILTHLWEISKAK